MYRWIHLLISVRLLVALLTIWLLFVGSIHPIPDPSLGRLDKTRQIPCFSFARVPSLSIF